MTEPCDNHYDCQDCSAYLAQQTAAARAEGFKTGRRLLLECAVMMLFGASGKPITPEAGRAILEGVPMQEPGTNAPIEATEGGK